MLVIVEELNTNFYPVDVAVQPVFLSRLLSFGVSWLTIRCLRTVGKKPIPLITTYIQCTSPSTHILIHGNTNTIQYVVYNVLTLATFH